MKLKVSQVKKIIENVIKEIEVEKFQDLKSTKGSTHQMNVAKLIDDERKFFVKFSDAEIWNDSDPDPSIQCMSEYLAYKIYSLYPNIKIPQRVEIVVDKKNKRVGIASSAIVGKSALKFLAPRTLANKLESGVYVDVFMANWDVVGTDAGNLIVNDDEEVYRIDPGSAFNYRAQGGRKGARFNKDASELSTMLTTRIPGAGSIYQYANLKNAAKEFLSVSWSAISNVIDEVYNKTNKELLDAGLLKLSKQWSSEISSIKQILIDRHKVVTAHAQKMSK